MADTLSPNSRSALMSKIRGKDTGLERRVRTALHVAGFRFRLHDAKLPGTPDIVLRRHGAVVEVRGCFWHYHDIERCPYTTVPKTNSDWWRAKLERNAQRDERNELALRTAGWRVFVVWQCECRTAEKLSRKIRELTTSLRRPSVQLSGPPPASGTSEPAT